jgi:O-antigen/teichoic acid export membrane protein
MMLANAAIVIPIALVLAGLSGTIMSAYGQGFAEGQRAMIITVFTAVVFTIMAPVGQVIAASGRMWTGMWMNLGWAIILILSSWLLVDMGAEGLASARLIAYCVHGLWTFAFAYRCLHDPARSLEAQKNAEARPA